MGVWEVACPEDQDPCCAGCSRCRGWRAFERANRVYRPGVWLLPDSRRGVLRQRRAARKQTSSTDAAEAARAAVVAEKGVAAQTRFVEKCRAAWEADPGYLRRRRGLPTARRLEHTYAQVDRGGMPAEQLVRWQAQRRARGQPIGAVAQGAVGRKRRRVWPTGPMPHDVPAAGGAAGEHEPVASPVRRVGVRVAVVSPLTHERAAAHVRTGRSRRAVEHAAQRVVAYGGIETARAGVHLPPAASGRMAGRPMRGWVRDPDAEGRGPGDRGSTHLSDLAPIPKRPRRR